MTKRRTCSPTWSSVLRPRAGVSGVQLKVLVRDERAWSLSGDGRRSLTVRGATHIVKTWEADEFPELAANEYFCLQVALRAGLPVPAHALSDNGRFLVVERFDLDETGRYLGFEDACVLQGLPVAARVRCELRSAGEDAGLLRVARATTADTRPPLPAAGGVLRATQWRCASEEFRRGV